MLYIFWTPEKFNVQVLHRRIFFGTTFFLPGIKCELPQKNGVVYWNTLYTNHDQDCYSIPLRVHKTLND